MNITQDIKFEYINNLASSFKKLDKPTELFFNYVFSSPAGIAFLLSLINSKLEHISITEDNKT